MGDILSLIEKAEFEVSEEKAKEMSQKLRKAEFDFNDFLDQMNQIKKMGGMGSILNMMPGMSQLKGNVDIDEKSMDRVEAIILSMTKGGGSCQPVDLKSFQEAEDRQGSRRGGGRGQPDRQAV